ncbi:MAG: chromate efflux transporter [Verrucomicrobiales bacterium]
MTPSRESAAPNAPQHPSFKEAFLFWLKLGFISFGGPTGQIAIMHTELVEKRRWISEGRFLHALNYCMLLPGPEAQQLAIYIGWLLHRTWGGIVAGSLFVLPSMFILWGLSYIYVAYGTLPWVASIFAGLKPAVIAIVAAALIRIGSKALKNQVMWGLAGLAFIAIYFFKVPFPLIIGSAALIGFIGQKYWSRLFTPPAGHAIKNAGDHSIIDDENTAHSHASPTFARALRILVAGGVIWFFPIALLAWRLGADHALFKEAIFFSKAAMVTFGGAYAVLPYVSQQAVETYGWLNAAQMLDGLGLAESTPGPLIMVLQFVGFMGGYNQPGGLSPFAAATLGAFITTWATFIPCFIWIFLGAPHIEQLRGNKKLTASLTAVTAAVVGVILNLAIWFGHHVLFPENGPINYFGIAVAVAVFCGMQKWKWDVLPVVIGAGLVGLIRYMLFGA